MVWTAEPSAGDIQADSWLRSRKQNSRGLGDVDEGVAQIILNCLLGHSEGASDTHCGELAVMHEPVDRHLGDAHQCCDLGHSQEPDLAQ